MVSVEEASSIILSHLFTPKKEKIAIGNSNERILAQFVTADRDLPPFDRATMDGIAIRSAEFALGVRAFAITATASAGAPPLKLSKPRTCIEIMTGAVMPGGADTVVRYEDVEIANGVATIMENIIPGKAIHRRGIDARSGAKLLSPGTKISPAEIALMASVGLDTIEVWCCPRAAVISTGNELVPANQIPQIHQVRSSNTHALAAALSELGCKANLFHIDDDERLLSEKLSEIFIGHELIILSGGVSKGKFDFVPSVLESLNVKRLFHGVSQKPGKPFWFGIDDLHTVFALPGNPVSTTMCYYRFIRPWLMKSMGHSPLSTTAVLSNDFNFTPDLTYFLQVKVRFEAGKLLADPITGEGSGDFANLKDVDGFLELPASRAEFRAGESFPFFPFRNWS